MESLIKYIGRTWRCAVLYRNDKLAHEGLNGYQHTYILKICQNPGISQEQLALMIYVNKSNVARQLASLEQNGFITRRSSEKDKRVMQVFPTQKALDVYPKVRKLLLEWNACLTEDFTEEERNQLYSLMERVMNKAISQVEKDDKKEEKSCGES
ncbi:MAG TPA: MarR family transcriptional regulator [Clostridia bacterium]|nr:MarR family transcriptional regulator [Clostridia bacterium]